MDEFDPAIFYENYKERYAKAIKLGKDIEEEEEVCADIYAGLICPCGGEDCKYRNLERAESQLNSLVRERANLIRNMESIIREYKAALEVSYLELELEKELQDLAEFKLALKVREPEPTSQLEINVVQRPQSH
jgi:hypothetical protein